MDACHSSYFICSQQKHMIATFFSICYCWPANMHDLSELLLKATGHKMKQYNSIALMNPEVSHIQHNSAAATMSDARLTHPIAFVPVNGCDIVAFSHWTLKAP